MPWASQSTHWETSVGLSVGKVGRYPSKIARTKYIRTALR